MNPLECIRADEGTYIASPAAAPGPTVSSRAAAVIRSRAASCSFSSPTNTRTEPARQRCPAAPNAEVRTPRVINSGLASGITTKAFFAPPNA